MALDTLDTFDTFDENIQELENSADDMKYLTFQIDEQHYGIAISNVIEIVQMQPITGMPELPFYVKGIINLRGQVIPLIDVNIRFGKPEKGYTDRTCIIIVDIEGLHVGFIVDEVQDVLDIENERISPPPSLSGETTRYVTGISKMDGYMVLLLNCRLLFSDSEIFFLEQAAT